MSADRRRLQVRAAVLRVVGRLMIVVATIAMFGATAFMASAVATSFGVNRGPGPAPALLPGLLVWVGGAAAMVLLGAGGFRVHRLGRRLAAAAVAAPVPSDEPIVLYLRPFDADVAFAGTGGGFAFGVGSILTHEEQLRDAFRTVGPMLAISHPGAELQQVGAVRTRADDDQWQRTVLEMLGRAALVIITLGGSSGVRWEIERAVEHVAPERLLLLSLIDEDWYVDAHRRLARSFPKGLPPYPAGGGPRRTLITAAIWFRPDWTPTAVRLDGGNVTHPIESACVYQLRPVFDALHARWPVPRTRLLRRSGMTARATRSGCRGCLLTIVLVLALVVVAVVLAA